MKCRYCNIALAPLRTLTDGEFCCDEHRVAHRELGGGEAVSAPPPEGGLIPLAARLETANSESAVPSQSEAAPIEFRPKTMAAPAFCSPAEAHGLKSWLHLPDRLLALKFGAQLFNTPSTKVTPSSGTAEFAATPLLPGAQVEQSGPAPEATLLAGDDEVFAEDGHPGFDHMAHEAARSWRWMLDVWQKAPSELRIMTILLPILLALAVSPSMPKVKIANASGKNVQKMVAEQLNTLNKSIVDRAAIAFTDDFRSGLDGWESRSNLTTRWSYDASGFVQPGPLAVFRPSVDLTDYRFEFLGEIDKKGMGCAFRAPDLDNYYAVKFLVVRSGPLPEVHVVRYAVIGGKEGPRVEKPLPFVTRADMLYRIRVDVHGSDFAIRAQDQMVDFWSDNRIPRGGVGLFCGRGEKARVRWLEVSHQYDTLGRLCAYLAPYGFEGRNGNFN